MRLGEPKFIHPQVANPRHLVRSSLGPRHLQPVTTKSLVTPIGRRKLFRRVYMWGLDLYESRFREASRPCVFSRIRSDDAVRVLFFFTNGSVPVREGLGGRFGAENPRGL